MTMIRFLAGATVLLAAAAHADPLPAKLGQCADTVISNIGTRLEGMPGSGDEVQYDNGGRQVSYGAIKGLKGSREGDPVKLCLIAAPDDCSSDDDRGKVYRATNLRTHKSWEEPNSEHMCGGA
jgi:hypothetical protein